MSKKLTIIFASIAVVIVLCATFAAGYITAGSLAQNPTSGNSTTSFFIPGITTQTPEQPANLDLVEEAWAVIQKNYVDKTKLDSTALSRGAVKGLVEAIKDPYSAYMEPAVYKTFINSLQGTFEGIGAQVGMNKDNKPIIIAPLENSPALKAGVRSGDLIVSINGKSTEGLSLNDVVLNIRGPKGSTVKLQLIHEGETKPVEIEIVRAQIESSSVRWEMKGKVAYIRITSFDKTTNTDLNKALQAIDLKNTTGIIVDLRSNPGGIVQSVAEVASHFLKEGTVTTLVDNQGNKNVYPVRPNGISTDLPIVVLVDQYSASGSEVLTGALKDYKRADIAGVKTFGKGSYDINIQLKDGSAIYLTVGRWMTPNGQIIEGKGIEPDYVLTETGNDEIQWAVDFLNKPK
jgi:carboxyl-terminal processing protease